MRNPHVGTARRFLIVLSAVVSVAFPGVAAAQLSTSGGGGSAGNFQRNGQPNVFFWQLEDCTGQGPASQQFPDFGDSVLQSADDFLVYNPAQILQVMVVGDFGPYNGPMGPVTVEIYADDGPGGLPGSLRCAEVDADNYGSDATMDILMDGSCLLPAGIYWLSVYPVMSFAEFGQWYWSSNDSEFGSEFAFRDPDGIAGVPCSTWGLGSTDCGVGVTFPDLCFGIGMIWVDGGGSEVPAMSAVGAVVLASILLGSAILVLRRGRTT